MHRFKEWLTGSVKGFASAFFVSRKERKRKMNKRNELPNERQDNTANERAYEALEITVIVFGNEDVITASGDDGEWDLD